MHAGGGLVPRSELSFWGNVSQSLRFAYRFAYSFVSCTFGVVRRREDIRLTMAGVTLVLVVVYGVCYLWMYPDAYHRLLHLADFFLRVITALQSILVFVDHEYNRNRPHRHNKKGGDGKHDERERLIKK